MIYSEIIEKIAELGGIETIGVASEQHRTAICFSGTKEKKYMYGMRKTAVIMQVSQLGGNSEQKEIVDNLCRIGARLSALSPEIKGIRQPKITVTSPPTPTVHNEKYWIYSMIIQITFYTDTKGMI